MDEATAISRFSKFFITKFRATLLMLIGIFVLGYMSYVNFLPRDGFPSIEIPLASVQVAYFVDDTEKFDTELLAPLEDLLADEEDISTVQSATDGSFGNLFIQFKDGITNEEGADIVNEIVNDKLELPEGAQVSVSPLRVDAIDNENDLIFTLYSKDKDYSDLESKAAELADEIDGERGIKTATVKEVVVERVNPFTGESVESKERFTRIGVREDGELKFYPAVSVGIIGESDFSAIQLSEATQGAVDTAEESVSLDGYSISFNGDISEDINKQIVDLEDNFLAGLIAVTAVLILFVNWRASIVAVIFIPAVLAGTFLSMSLTGRTLNVISLFALVLSLGLLVDDAIVVIESIDRNKKAGLKGVKAVVQSVKEIGVADVLGTVTTMLVFAPMLFISGVLGEFIAEMPRTLIITLFFSLFLALSVVPLLSNWIIRSHGKHYKPNMFVKIIEYPSTLVIRLAGWIADMTKRSFDLKYPAVMILIGSIAFVFIGFGYAGRLAQERFNPFPTASDAEDLLVVGNFEEGVDIDSAERISRDVEDFLAENYSDEVTRYDYYIASKQFVWANISLTDLSTRDVKAGEISQALTDEFNGVEEASFQFLVQGAGPPPGEFPYQMQVFGENQADLELLTSDIESYLADQDDVEDVVVSNISTLVKKDGERFATVQAKITDADNTQLVLDLQELVKAEFDEDRLVDDYGLESDALGFDLGQQSENLESFQSLGLISIIAIIMMYALLVLQFDSFSQPFLIIFVALMLAMPGVFIGLWFTGNFLSFIGAIGMIGLIGIVVNNTIMLVDFANQYRKTTDSAVDAIVEAIRVRFRPLMTTTVTTIFGLLPLALNDPFWEPISYTIIFGLISSAVFVVIAFPVYYVIVEWVRGKFWGLFN